MISIRTLVLLMATTAAISSTVRASPEHSSSSTDIYNPYYDNANKIGIIDTLAISASDCSHIRELGTNDFCHGLDDTMATSCLTGLKS
ncbi:hypothetical protein HDU76_004165, partial [Blyttiomyces sp. JEL0837]